MFRPRRLMRNIVPQTYAFYDFETTGLNPVFDQALRGAFLRTNLNFHEQSRQEIHVRLSPDVIPSPGALVVNRLPVSSLFTGECEYEAMKKFHGIVNVPGTTSVGFNSLSFDDQFLRFGFWRNLLSPYAHQHANQCRRMDIYPMTVTYKLLCPEHLQWKSREDGKVGFRLEEMNEANQLITDGRAHDAMTDVRVTLALAQRLALQKEIWDFCWRFFDKEADEHQIADCFDTVNVGDDHYKYGLMISHRSKGKEITPALLLGHSVAYANQTVWLKLDNQDLFLCASSKPDIRIKQAKVFSKTFGKPPFFIPLDGVVAGKLTTKDESFAGMLKQAFSWIVNNPAEFKAIRDYYLNFQYEKHDCDVNAKLYEVSFPSPKEKELFQAFHAAKLEDKPAIAEKFPRSEHRELSMRLFGRNFPELLSAEGKKKFADHVERVFSENDNCVPVDHMGERQFSVSQARLEIETLTKKDLDAEQREILKDYEQWLSSVGKNKMRFFDGLKAEKTNCSNQTEIRVKAPGSLGTHC